MHVFVVAEKIWTNLRIMTSVQWVYTVYVLSPCSGLLLMYNVMKRLKRSDGEIHWGKFYLHRYLRYRKSTESWNFETAKPIAIRKCRCKTIFFSLFHCYHQRKIRWLERDLNSHLRVSRPPLNPLSYQYQNRFLPLKLYKSRYQSSLTR